MTTFLLIVLAVLIAANVWLMIYMAKREKQRRKLLQERLDECDKTVGELSVEKGRLKLQLDEKAKLVAELKATLAERLNEIERLQDEIAALYEDPHAGCQDPVNGGEPSVHTEPGDPVDKPLKPLNLAALDLQDLKQTYDELAKSYDFVSRQYENPSKRYIINNLVRLYEVKNLGLLAKALGVSTSSLSQKIKK